MYLIKRFFKNDSTGREDARKKKEVRKYDIAIRIPDGQLKKFPGDRCRLAALERARRIEALVQAKLRGDDPPATLNSWIENMPKRLADRLIALGLIEQRKRDQNQPLETLIDGFYSAVASRKGNKARSAYMAAGTVRRICLAIGFRRFSDLNEEKINKWLREITVACGERKGQPLSARARREYIICLKTFCNWMLDSDRASKNPLARMKAPGPREQPVRRRRGMTLDEIRKLLGYLDQLPDDGKAWGPVGRKMFYWTLIKTAIRKSEARTLRCFSLQTARFPATVSVEAAYAKDKKQGCVPIESDLAKALTIYIGARPTSDLLFPMPTSELLLRAFYADLKAIGIARKNERGEYLDIHSLRHTAITHWLTVDGLLVKDVQFMARLMSVRLVDTYSTGYRPDQFPHLEKSPSLFPPPKTDQPPQAGGNPSQDSDQQQRKAG